MSPERVSSREAPLEAQGVVLHGIKFHPQKKIKQIEKKDLVNGQMDEPALPETSAVFAARFQQDIARAEDNQETE